MAMEFTVHSEDSLMSDLEKPQEERFSVMEMLFKPLFNSTFEHHCLTFDLLEKCNTDLLAEMDHAIAHHIVFDEMGLHDVDRAVGPSGGMFQLVSHLLVAVVSEVLLWTPTNAEHFCRSLEDAATEEDCRVLRYAIPSLVVNFYAERASLNQRFPQLNLSHPLAWQIALFRVAAEFGVKPLDLSRQSVLSVLQSAAALDQPRPAAVQ